MRYTNKTILSAVLDTASKVVYSRDGATATPNATPKGMDFDSLDVAEFLMRLESALDLPAGAIDDDWVERDIDPDMTFTEVADRLTRHLHDREKGGRL